MVAFDGRWLPVASSGGKASGGSGSGSVWVGLSSVLLSPGLIQISVVING